MGTTNILDLNNRVGALKKDIAENAEDTHDIEKDIYAVMGKMGAKNLNSYPYRENSKTVNGVTFTVKPDGSVTVQTDENGATASTGFSCHSRGPGEQNDLVIQNGKYILTGCPAGGANNKYSITVRATKNDTSYLYGADYGNGVEITLSGDDYSANEVNVQVDINIAKNIIITTPITFYPMLRLASDTDDTYQPYAKTNKELTDGFNAVKEQLPDAPTTDGTYRLTAAVVNGIPSYSWVSD